MGKTGLVQPWRTLSTRITATTMTVVTTGG